MDDKIGVPTALSILPMALHFMMPQLLSATLRAVSI